jgi:16S rRNA (guanine1516-N2)-methyltransferase
MASLLEFAIEQARTRGDAWQQSVAGRLQLHAMDARRISGETLEKVDVIYLDPMFPDARRALPGKEMQVLAALLAGESAAAESAAGPGDAADDSLLAWACGRSVRRVVVKRPRRAPPLAGPRPSHQLAGRSVRFDVYALSRAAT